MQRRAQGAVKPAKPAGRGHTSTGVPALQHRASGKVTESSDNLSRGEGSPEVRQPGHHHDSMHGSSAGGSDTAPVGDTSVQFHPDVSHKESVSPVLIGGGTLKPKGRTAPRPGRHGPNYAALLRFDGEKMRRSEGAAGSADRKRGVLSEIAFASIARKTKASRAANENIFATLSQQDEPGPAQKEEREQRESD